jgi:hypothetical protein
VAGGRNSEILGKLGNGVIIASLIAQTLWFMFFVVIAGSFHRRLKLAPTPASQNPNFRWKSYLCTLYFVGAMVVIRSVFRAAEFIEGSHGVLMTSEVFLYTLDSLLMFAVVAVLHWRHPGEISVLARGGLPYGNGFKLFSIKA